MTKAPLRQPRDKDKNDSCVHLELQFLYFFNGSLTKSFHSWYAATFTSSKKSIEHLNRAFTHELVVLNDDQLKKKKMKFSFYGNSLDSSNSHLIYTQSSI